MDFQDLVTGLHFAKEKHVNVPVQMAGTFVIAPPARQPFLLVNWSSFGRRLSS